MPARKGPGYASIWTRAVGNDPDLSPTARLVAVLALTRFYSADKREFYLSLSMATALARVSKSAVQRAFLALIEAGWLVRTRRPTPNDAARWTLAIPLAAMERPDPVTHKTPRQLLRNAGVDNPPASGQDEHPASGQDDYSRVVTVTRTSGQGDHQPRINPGLPRSANGSGPHDPPVAPRYSECAVCGHPVRLGAALCDKCKPDAATPRGYGPTPDDWQGTRLDYVRHVKAIRGAS